MPAINIYISNEIKIEMDKYPKINWSKIAKEAFEIKLKSLSRDWIDLKE